MEQRSPTNTGFTPGALVERRMTFESKKNTNLLQFLKQKQRNCKPRLHWFADATGALFIPRPEGMRVVGRGGNMLYVDLIKEM